MNTRRLPDDMRCPNCNSHYTQYLPTCFALTRQSGHYYPDENHFHRLIERPERRSVFVVPLLSGFVVHVCTTIAVDFKNMQSDAGWLPTHVPYLPEFLTPVAFLSAAVTYALWARAWFYNKRKYVRLHEEWMGSAICRRCSTRFKAPSNIVTAFRSQL